MSAPAALGRGHIIPNIITLVGGGGGPFSSAKFSFKCFILENSWSVPGLEPPDGNPFHALIGVHPEEEEKESEDEEEDLEEDMEEEEEDGDEEEIHVT